jgi:hypothetical protein
MDDIGTHAVARHGIAQLFLTYLPDIAGGKLKALYADPLQRGKHLVICSVGDATQMSDLPKEDAFSHNMTSVPFDLYTQYSTESLAVSTFFSQCR